MTLPRSTSNRTPSLRDLIMLLLDDYEAVTTLIEKNGLHTGMNDEDRQILVSQLRAKCAQNSDTRRSVSDARLCEAYVTDCFTRTSEVEVLESVYAFKKNSSKMLCHRAVIKSALS